MLCSASVGITERLKYMKIWILLAAIALASTNLFVTTSALAAPQCNETQLKQTYIHFAQLHKFSESFNRLFQNKKIVNCYSPKQTFAILNSEQRDIVSQNTQVSKFTLRYLTDLTTALYLKGDIQESDIQVINNNGAYFATFTINEQTVSTLLDATQGKYSPLAVLQSMQTVGENLQDETVLLAGVPEDVLPDVKDQPIQNQKIFMKLFTENSSKFSWEELIDFSFELLGSLAGLQDEPLEIISDLQDFQDTYDIDMSQVIEIAENNQERLDKAKIESEQNLVAAVQRWKELDAEWRRLDAEWRRLDTEWRRLDAEWKIIMERQQAIKEVFAMLAKK